ncbi:MAG: hypothetical protein QXI34_12085 [Metallosphaera sp.]
MGSPGPEEVRRRSIQIGSGSAAEEVLIVLRRSGRSRPKEVQVQVEGPGLRCSSGLRS